MSGAQTRAAGASGNRGDPQVEEQVKYVEVECVEERIVKRPVVQYVDRLVQVPQYNVELVDRIIEVPRTQYVEKPVEKIEYVDRIKPVPVTKKVEVPQEVITYVPKVDVQVVEKVVEVPGQTIEVPKHVEVIHQKLVNMYVDHDVSTVVAQTYKPSVIESTEEKQVAKLKKFVPYLVPVEVKVPVPVSRNLIATGETKQTMQSVNIPAAQYNAQIRNLNPNLEDKDLTSLFRRNPDGSISTYDGPGVNIVPPQPLN